jgi:hypothetical protein
MAVMTSPGYATFTAACCDRHARDLHLHSPHPAIGCLVHNHRGVAAVDDQLSSCHLLEPLISAGMVEVAMGIDNIDTA